VLKILGIIVMAAVIGFPMVSCGDDSGGIVSVIGGVLTLTNLESGKYVVAWGNNDTLVALSVNKQNGEKVGQDGTAVLSVWNVEGTNLTPYKGSDTVLFWVTVSSSPNVNLDDGSDGGEEGGWALGIFKNGVGGGAFTDKLSDINIPDTNGGILTLTGLSAYNGSYVVARADDEGLVAAKNVNAQNGRGVKISGGKAILNVWKKEGSGYAPYKGNDTVLFTVDIYSKAAVSIGEETDKGGNALATFQKGIGAGVFTDILSGIDNPDPTTGKLTLTGLDDYNGKYVAAFGSNDDSTLSLLAASSVDLTEEKGKGKGVKIKNGKAVMNVWTATTGDIGITAVNSYKENDTMTFDVYIIDGEDIDLDKEPETENSGKALTTFKKGIGAGIFYLDTDQPEPSTNAEISINITVPAALVGTWKGDATNGTLVFTASSISTTDKTTKANACIAGIKKANTSSALTINANGTITQLVGNIAYVNLYTWKIDGTTLTIKDNLYGTTAFTGTKQ
jgi:hypothetical protein